MLCNIVNMYMKSQPMGFHSALEQWLSPLFLLPLLIKM